VGDVVLVNIADISNGLGTDLLCGYQLHIVEPKIRVQRIGTLRNSRCDGLLIAISLLTYPGW
jgi:hypothetical protein